MREVFDAVILRIPVFGRAVRHMAYARFCRSFYLLYISGIPIITAAEMAVNMTGNSIISKLLRGVVTNAQAGGDIEVLYSYGCELVDGFNGGIAFEVIDSEYLHTIDESGRNSLPKP